LLKPPFDYNLIVAQLPSQSPSEIDAALEALSEYCVTKGTSLPEGLEEQLLHVENPSVLVSLARYCQSAEIFNILWNRATTAPISSDGDFFRKGLRRACVLNRLAPLTEFTRLSDPEDIWGKDKLEWLTDYFRGDTSETEKDYERWWDTVKLLQNENVPIRILAAAISRSGAFSKFEHDEHASLLHHISSNPILSNRSRDNRYLSVLTHAISSLLDTRPMSSKFREAVCNLLVSLGEGFRHIRVPAFALNQWQFPKMEEFRYHRPNGFEWHENRADLMSMVAFATNPMNATVDADTPPFYLYAKSYAHGSLSLREMVKGMKKDGSFFCLLAMWNCEIMLSGTKRALLEHMISERNLIARVSPISSEELRKIYDQRLQILKEYYGEQSFDLSPQYVWASEYLPDLFELRLKSRFRRLFGRSNEKEDLMLIIAWEIYVVQNGGLVGVFFKEAKQVLGFILGFLIFLFLMTSIILYFGEGEELTAFGELVKSLFTSPP
jgi:hypothetical protein